MNKIADLKPTVLNHLDVNFQYYTAVLTKSVSITENVSPLGLPPRRNTTYALRKHHNISLMAAATAAKNKLK